eukprot:8961234-Pyramimonas_sp.AAC.1
MCTGRAGAGTACGWGRGGAGACKREHERGGGGGGGADQAHDRETGGAATCGAGRLRAAIRSV